MLFFIKKNLIKWGLNLTIKNISKYKFLNKIILTNKFFFSVINLKLLAFKLLTFYNFIQLYIKNLKYKRTILFLDGTLNQEQQKLNKVYLLQYKYYYLNNYNWLPVLINHVQYKKINYLIFWNYHSFFFKFNPFLLNLPFFFFFQKPCNWIKNIKFNWIKNSNFIMTNENKEINYFFWLCSINQLLLL